jgi:hypothetical protein
MVDFIGIGAQKAGTTWLWEMLRQHPNVYFGPLKEVHYFDVIYLRANRARRQQVLEHAVDHMVAEQRSAAVSQEQIDRTIHLKDPSFTFTDAWYEAMFADAPAGTKSGDITPLYCTLNDEGIAHVRKVSPRARLVYMIRDPVQRAISSVRQLANEQKSVETILHSWRFLARGDYRSNIPRWDRHFPAEQLLYVPFGDVKNDPQGVLRTVERHLGLPAFEAYRDIAVPQRSTAGKDVKLPKDIEQRVTEIFTGQTDYLRERFGPDFVSRIA